MPRIPGYVAEKSLDTAPQTMPRLQAPTATAAAIGKIGNTIEDFGLKLINHEEQKRTNLEEFSADQKFQRFNMERQQDLDTFSKQAPDGGLDLTVKYNEHVAERSKEFLEREIPERLRPRYQERMATLGTRLGSSAAETEAKLRNDFYKTGITNQAGMMGAELQNNPEAFMQTREKLFSDIDKSSLPAVEKAALKSRHGIMITKAAIEGLTRQGRYEEAEEVSKSFAGFGRAGADTPTLTAGKKEVAQRITEIAGEMGVDASTAVAIAMLESSLNPAAVPKGTPKNPNPTPDGLFQLRDKEKAQYGIKRGDTVDNQIRGGLQLIKDRAGELQKAGIPVTPVTVYMAHFQGVGGAKAILTANPGEPLADVLTRVQSRQYAEAVLDGNKLPGNITAGQFTQLISRRVNGAITAAGSTELGYAERTSLVDWTQTTIKRHQMEVKRETEQAKLETKNLIDNDVQSILSTGKEIGHLSEARVADHLGEQAAREWVSKREGARRLYESTKDFDTIPATQIQDRLELLAHDKENKGGTAGFIAADSVYNEAKKKADRVIKLRIDDPARAVESDPMVAQAMAIYDPSNSATVQNLVTARIEAQKKIGISNNAVMPVTAAEATQLAQVLVEANDTNRKQTVDRMVAEVVQKYGPHADAVLTAVVGQYVKDRDTAAMMAGAIRKLASGGRPSPAERATAARAVEADQSQQAMHGTPAFSRQESDPDLAAAWMGGGPTPRSLTGKAGEKPDPNDYGTFARSFKPQRPWNQDDIARLQKSPELQGAFDERYGEGASQFVLTALERARQQNKPQEKKPGG